MKHELEAARKLAVKAGGILLEHYAETVSVDWKSYGDPVTEADRAASKLLMLDLGRQFPDDAILCEESPDSSGRLRKSRVWIVDPMVGTKEFIAHRDEFSVMIGLAIDGVAALGVVYQPVSGKLYYAAAGMGAFLEDGTAPAKRLEVSQETDPAAMIIALSRSHHSTKVDSIRKGLGVEQTVLSGSIGLKVGLISDQRAHIYIHAGSGTHQWDTCAPEAILREAGGRLTDLFNAPLKYNRAETRNSKGVIASTGTIHDRISEVAQAVMAPSRA